MISKNNNLKAKIKKIKRFMIALCKIISEAQAKYQEKDENKRGRPFKHEGGDNDTDSDNQ